MLVANFCEDLNPVVKRMGGCRSKSSLIIAFKFKNKASRIPLVLTEALIENFPKKMVLTSISSRAAEPATNNTAAESKQQQMAYIHTLGKVCVK